MAADAALARASCRPQSLRRRDEAPHGPPLYPQWFGCFNPHGAFSLHAPQSIATPHTSLAMPQSAWSFSQVGGGQPQWFGPPTPHTRPSAHSPQCNTPPQGDGTSPQSTPAWHVIGTQTAIPHLLGPDAPHISRVGQVPHVSMPPHPSSTSPHSASSSVQVFTWHPGPSGSSAASAPAALEPPVPPAVLASSVPPSGVTPGPGSLD
jgi:hypothetical protein